MAWYSARYLGGRNPYSWDPEDQSLGGSEQAVVELSSAWAVRGLTVAVYGQFSPSRIYRNVIYRDARTFRGDLQYKNLIIWRALGADLFNPSTSPSSASPFPLALFPLFRVGLGEASFPFGLPHRSPSILR